MKKIISYVVLIIFLSSCGSDEKIVEENIKADFNIETISGGETTDTVYLRKTGQVNSSQDISLSANAAGRVWSLRVKPGDQVFAGQVLAVLQDNIWSYGIDLQRSSNSVERAQINYESTELSLDKAVFDAKLNLDTLEKNLIALKNDSQQNILLAQDTLRNSEYDNLDSSSALQLERLDNDIAKSKLDYEIRISSDSQTVEWYKSNLKKEFSSVLTILIDVQEFADNLLGVTPNNRTEDDDIENFFWAQNPVQKTQTKETLRDLISFRQWGNFSSINSLVRKNDISEQEMIQVVDFIDDAYSLAIDLLNSLEITLNNSIRSEWRFWQAEIDAVTNSLNSQQSQAQNSFWAYITLGTTIKNFLTTYRDSQASLLKSIQLQENDREIQYKTLSSSQLSATTGLERTIITTQDSITNLESQINNARENLSNAEKNRDVTLRSLRNSIEESQISYASSLKEFWKLTLTSPINGIIWEVYIDIGQELSLGTLAFDIVSSSTPEVKISFSKSEREIISKNLTVELEIGDRVLEWTIDSISEVADENLNYDAKILFDSSVSLIGNIVSVSVPVTTGKMLLPINIIEVKWDDIGLVKTLSWSTFSDVRVRLWDVFWEYIEIVSCAKNCVDLEIITSDISNFDENKFKIVQQ